jgi:hypothetical protein
MAALVVVALYLLALAGCGWLFWQSAKLIIHGFKRAFAPSFVPTFGIDGPMMPGPSLGGGTGGTTAENPNPVPGWTARMVGNHIAHCQVCRESYVTGTLPLLLPETLSRIVGICEAEDATLNQRT